jgi:hypothetical protein
MKRLFFLLPCLAFLGGCCACQKPVKEPPAAITLDEQVRRLSEWRQALPRVRADLGPLGAHLEYPDEKGAMQSHNSEGYLLLQQHFDAAPGSAESRGDVYLAGKVLDTTKVFEAGRNATAWWFAIFLDQNTVRTGDASVSVNLASLSDPESAGIFRADLVFDMLGLSELPPAHNLVRQNGAVKYLRDGPGLEKAMLMRVDDFTGTNELLIEEFTAGGVLYLSREILVDRFSGNVSEVRIYNPAGVLVVRSELGEYAPVTYAEGVTRPAAASVPQFPRRVRVTYPAQKTIITLHFNAVTVPEAFRPAAFSTPRFDNLHVIREK